MNSKKRSFFSSQLLSSKYRPGLVEILKNVKDYLKNIERATTPDWQINITDMDQLKDVWIFSPEIFSSLVSRIYPSSKWSGRFGRNFLFYGDSGSPVYFIEILHGEESVIYREGQPYCLMA